jgi:ketosteroid isomerase-like protein
MDLAATTAQLFGHFESHSIEGVRDMFAPDARVRQNGTPEHDIEGLVSMIKGLQRDGVRVEYSDIRRTVGDRFVVEQHVVKLTRPDGVSASTDACVVMHFDDDGMITGMHEYVDSAAFAQLLV